MPLKAPDETGAGTPEWTSIEQVFAALEAPLLGYARRLLGDHALAEDVVQDAFMKLHASFAQIRQPQAWLYRAVHNAAVDHQRRANKIVPLPGATDEEGDARVETADSAPMPDEQIARWERIGLVRLVLETLDARSRTVIALRFHEELSYDQIAARTGLTSGHVGYLLHHALKAMAAELAKTELAP